MARQVICVPAEAKFTVCPGVADSHVVPPSLETCTDTEVPEGTKAKTPANFSEETALEMVVVAPCTVADVPEGERSSYSAPSPATWNCRA